MHFFFETLEGGVCAWLRSIINRDNNVRLQVIRCRSDGV
jgi:hypothetical protein